LFAQDDIPGRAADRSSSYTRHLGVTESRIAFSDSFVVPASFLFDQFAISQFVLVEQWMSPEMRRTFHLRLLEAMKYTGIVEIGIQVRRGTRSLQALRH